MAEVLQRDRKHSGKRRNCSLRAISSFPTVFSKDSCSRDIKTRACLGSKGLCCMFSRTMEINIGKNATPCSITDTTVFKIQLILCYCYFKYLDSPF